MEISSTSDIMHTCRHMKRQNYPSLISSNITCPSLIQSCGEHFTLEILFTDHSCRDIVKIEIDKLDFAKVKKC